MVAKRNDDGSNVPPILVQTIQTIFDLTSRIDERVKTVVERQAEQHQAIEELNEIIDVLKTKVERLESKATVSEGRYSRLVEILFKLLITVGGAYVCFKLGIGSH